MKNQDDFDAELADLLAHAAPRRAPPAALKTRLLAAIRPEPPLPLLARVGRWAMAGAIACLMLIPVFVPRDLGISVALIKGKASRAEGRISLSGDGEALVRIPGRAVIRLSRGAEAEIVRAGPGIEVRLNRGWALSAVKPGKVFRVTTAFGGAEALGTQFIVKAEPGRTYICICHGKLRLKGGFPHTEIASPHHYDVFLTRFAASPADKEGSPAGHSDEELASLPLP